MINKDEIEAVRKIAVECRQFLESNPSFFNIEMKFPMGWCGAASKYLQRLLENAGYYANYLCRRNDHDQSHAWLNYKGLIVDITADQDSGMESVIIIEEELSTFHKTYYLPDWC